MIGHKVHFLLRHVINNTLAFNVAFTVTVDEVSWFHNATMGLVDLNAAVLVEVNR